MAKVGLIIFGVLILIITVVATQIILTPAQKSDIKTANNLCTAEVNVAGVNLALGSWGQKLLGAEEDCQKVRYFMLLINYGWIGYVIGGFFLILGIFLGGGYTEREMRKNKRGSFCGSCGTELEGYEKHCPECGNRV